MIVLNFDIFILFFCVGPIPLVPDPLKGSHCENTCFIDLVFFSSWKVLHLGLFHQLILCYMWIFVDLLVKVKQAPFYVLIVSWNWLLLEHLYTSVYLKWTSPKSTNQVKTSTSYRLQVQITCKVVMVNVIKCLFNCPLRLVQPTSTLTHSPGTVSYIQCVFGTFLIQVMFTLSPILI
jgi:hypothetical protein